jgi:hypothetical protein
MLCCQDQRNAKYLEYIGFPIVVIALISAQRSLNRLLETQNCMLKITDTIAAKANLHHIQHGYSNALQSLFLEIGTYVTCYQSFLMRVADLQELLRK